MHQVDGEDLSCELKVSASMDNARIVVVRDVTERYRRFDRTSEYGVLAPAAGCPSDFTRHEVKNGLLVGIELCDSLTEFLCGR
jgi:hypothetical protein